MAKRAHHYRVTVAPISSASELESLEPLTFEHINHDDLCVIVERVRAGLDLSPDTAAAVAIGLKLLGEIVLSERDNPLFDPLRAPLREFTQELKRKLLEAHQATTATT